jgi:hypothetical protein
MTLKYSLSEMLNFLIDYYNKYNEIPIGSSCSSSDIPLSSCSYRRRFGSWREALKKANLPYKKRARKRISKEKIINEVVDFYKQYHRNPKIYELSMSQQTIRSNFGTWSNLLKEVGLKPLKMPQQKLNCKVCGKEVIRDRSARRRNKNHFCSYSCASKYNQTCRSAHGRGYQRSKAECFIEEALLKEFPNMEILFNDNKVIGLELDIYIPSLKLAFEINGIFHYNPIFGIEKLKRTQELDKQKVLRCIENNIKLWVIDISKVKRAEQIKKIQPYINQIIANINLFILNK